MGRLRRVKDRLRTDVATYERNATPCIACDTPGACCLDTHFVNVQISRLEAAAIAEVIEALDPIRRAAVNERIVETVAILHPNAERHSSTFACPLYERGTGCLVHNEAKPVPCIVHACYGRRDDLPPDDLQDAAELVVDKLNTTVYGRSLPHAALPIAVQAAVASRRRMKNAITRPARNQPAI
ncbi:MAG TPA: hypothetical protein VGO43_15920 [Pyrinomonadaceae bacterium]|nr:hypothetical protein [Pyrinomonadaceae bacterium]